MAIIYLRHPKHGVKIATMDLEADYDEQNGWERFDPDEPNIDAPVRRRGRRSVTPVDNALLVRRDDQIE